MSSQQSTLRIKHPDPGGIEASHHRSFVTTCAPMRCNTWPQMFLAPHSRGTQRLLRPDGIFVPLALMYGILLARSWAPDTLALMMPGSLQQGFAGTCCLHIRNSASPFRRFINRWRCRHGVCRVILQEEGSRRSSCLRWMASCSSSPDLPRRLHCGYTCFASISSLRAGHTSMVRVAAILSARALVHVAQRRCISTCAKPSHAATGLRQRFPTRITVLLAAAFGPLGVLSHFTTQAIVAIWRGGFNRAQESLAGR